MSNVHQKNRYLRLDGSPIEQGGMRRTLAPRGIALSFLVAVGATTDVTKLDNVRELIEPVLFVVFGLAQRRILNIAVNTGWIMDFHRYVIDTKPSPRTQHNPPNSYHVTSTYCTAVYAITGLSCIVNVGPNYAGMPYVDAISETFLPDIATQFPTLHLAFQQGYAHYKVRKGEWKVIKRVNMEPENTPSSLTVCQPVLGTA